MLQYPIPVHDRALPRRGDETTAELPQGPVEEADDGGSRLFGIHIHGGRAGSVDRR